VRVVVHRRRVGGRMRVGMMGTPGMYGVARCLRRRVLCPDFWGWVIIAAAPRERKGTIEVAPLVSVLQRHLPGVPQSAAANPRLIILGQSVGFELLAVIPVVSLHPLGRRVPKSADPGPCGPGTS
jgi:hypothetical protein